MKCSKCGKTNDENANYCEKCGSMLNKAPVQQGFFSKNSNIIVGIGAGVLIVAIIGFIFINNKNTRAPKQYTGRNFYNSENIRNKVLAIASNFTCSCGGCNEPALEKCECPKAVEEREYINNLVIQDMREEQIINAVEEKYGGKRKFTGDVLSSEAEYNDILKELRMEDCPCGKCNMKFKDCDCHHGEKGSYEIKNYILNRLRNTDMSKKEILDDVKVKFFAVGGEKF